MKKVLFFRNYGGLQGGHLKVWDYYNHIQSSAEYRAHIYFPPNSLLDEENPWFAIKDQCLKTIDFDLYDLIFLAGCDWEFLPEPMRIHPPRPVINLVQHIRHANPNTLLYHFLHYPAIRICVSQQVTEALTRTKRVNGPILTIPNALPQIPLINALEYPHKIEILILAVKHPGLGKELYHTLLDRFGSHIFLVTKLIERNRLLAMMKNAAITVYLPNPEGEGFYLPALEGMAVGTFVICPDCVGNRSFCLPDKTCLMPEYNLEQLVRACEIATALAKESKAIFCENGYRMVAKHSLEEERQRFLQVLQNLECLWQQTYPVQQETSNMLDKIVSNVCNYLKYGKKALDK